jgi:transglutaminase-like putative cysteine protease
MRYRIRHETRYAYESPVDLAAHILHLRPRAMPGQRVLSEALAVEPPPARRIDRPDCFGNLATWLFLERPHDAFFVGSEAVVDIAAPSVPVPQDTPAWERVAQAAPHGGAEAAEFLFPSPMAAASAAARDYAASSFPPGRPVLEGLLDLNARIFRDFAFRPGVTRVATPVADVMERREGVCQDFTHTMLSALRGLGLPARYVSGYIRTRPPPGAERHQGADQSHAWAGCWLGPDHGWIGLDPTNNLVVAEEHVVLAWGRDYSDVCPLRGVILGGGEHSLKVAVDLEPEG